MSKGYNVAMNKCFISSTGDGRYNLAFDEHLLNAYRDGRLAGVTLYFYVNKNAVIIGRNQNAWKECRTAAMDADGVQLVRRHTGGGAVYHDEGNLNFSFITDEKNYSVERQTQVIIQAVKTFGVDAQLSGRNDILANGRKFSGNAYGIAGTARSQHGTVLVNTDMTRLANYLNVSEKKIRSKGVDSVRGRVCNLNEFCNNVTVPAMREAIIKSFVREYGECEGYMPNETAQAEVNLLYAKHISWEWLFGAAPTFDWQLDERLSFGDVQLLLQLKNGVVYSSNVYTDCLNTSISQEISQSLKDVRFDREALAAALSTGGAESRELAAFIREKGI